MDSRRYYFTCHPRYIEKKSQELVSSLAGRHSYPYRTVQDIARTVYAVGITRPSHTRTVALIALSMSKELVWRNVQWKMDFLDELVDLAVTKFVTSWADEIDRLSEVSEADISAYESSGTSSDEDDLLFKASNPRLDECTYNVLYDEEEEEDYGAEHVPPATYQPRPQILVSCVSPTPSVAYETEEPNLGADDADDIDTPLLAATIILGDLFAMGLVPVQIMQTSTLYLAENLMNANDGHLLHTLLTRAASHLAPQLGVPFLQQCRAYVVKNKSVLEANGYYKVYSILNVIDELIECESNYSAGNNAAVYSHLASHRWDPNLSADISWVFED